MSSITRIYHRIKARLHKALEPIDKFTAPAIEPLRRRWLAFDEKHPVIGKWVRRAMRVFLIFYAVYLLFVVGLFGDIPTVKQLKALQTQTASEVFTQDGALMGRLYNQNRTLIKYRELPKNLVHALISTEDSRFFDHSGVDYRSYARVLFKTILGGDGSSGGGSTLSQQVAKNIFPRKKYAISFLSIPINKIREAIIAVRLEDAYSKEDLIALYLNTVPFPQNVFGIETASKRFFSTSPAKLTTEQSALLVGTLKATTAYNPKKNPENAVKRRNVVLDQMAQFPVRLPGGSWLRLSKAEADTLKKIPLELRYNIEAINEGIAPHYRKFLEKKVIPSILDSLAKKKDDGEPYDMYRDGLKIYTTVDSALQSYAEAATREHMRTVQRTFENHWAGMLTYDTLILEKLSDTELYKKLKKKNSNIGELISGMKRAKKRNMTVLTWEGERDMMMNEWDSMRHYVMLENAAFMAMEPESGNVRAWVGGHDFKYNQYDHVEQSKRQVGSIFKPIVYATALKSGVRPCEYISNQRVTYHLYETWEVKDRAKKDPSPHINKDTKKDEDDWTPDNVDGRYGGYMSMKEALSNSVNLVSVSLIMRTGAKAVADLAHEMGIKNSIPAEPSIALGSPDLTLYEMVNAFASFPRRGLKATPVHITHILNAKGEEIYRATPPRPADITRVLSQDQADVMINLMKAVVEQGTAGRLRYGFGLTGEIAGKTGTSQNHSDGWFVGFTPYLVGGVWVGAESPAIRFRDMNYGQGSYTALPIWGKFMRYVQDDPRFASLRETKFPMPSKDVLDSLNCAPRWWEPGTIDSIMYDSLGNPIGGPDLLMFDSLGNPIIPPAPPRPDTSAVMPSNNLPDDQ